MSRLTLVPQNVHFIRDVFTDFLLSREAMLCSPVTLEFYQYNTGVFVKCLVAQSVSEPSEIKSSHVRSYLKALKDRNLTDNTLHSYARAIMTFLRFCHSEGCISKPVTVEMPRVAKKTQPILNPDELERILSYCRNLKHKTLIMVMLDTGLRRAEVSLLQWKDIDISSGLVHVRRGKGGKSRSTVIGVKTRRILLRYRRTVPNEPNDSLGIFKKESRSGNSGARQTTIIDTIIKRRRYYSPCTLLAQAKRTVLI